VSGRRFAVAALSLAAGVAGLGFATIRATPAVGGPVFEIGRAHAEVAPVLAGEKPIFILLLGSDARPGIATDRGLSDSIHILGINPAERRASLVGIPRDSYVALSTGGNGKINAAMPKGGAEAMVATVEDLAGITFDYYALTSFTGLTQVVNAVGGLDIEVSSSFTGFEGTGCEGGEQTLTGAEARSGGWTRSRLPNGGCRR
jgi:LCP family protein required for cell wall assembly